MRLTWFKFFLTLIFEIAELTDFSFLMSVAVALLCKPQAAESAIIRFLAFVHPQVVFHVTKLLEWSAADGAN